jgi:hypothetical protein
MTQARQIMRRRPPSEDPATFERIRKLAIIAMFSDDLLMDRLVLKGGNALALVLAISSRTSVDLDFSLGEDFRDLADAAARIQRALEDRFDSAGLTVFDFKFLPKGGGEGADNATWGGYQIEFKVMARAAYAAVPDVARRRQQATVVAPGQQRTFKIQISRHEHCAAKLPRDVDGYTVFVYTPAAIVIEKLRALCQQLPEYPLIPPRMKRPRPRDCYDIHTVITGEAIDLATPEHVALLRDIFAIKQVPLRLLGQLDAYRDYHAVGFEAVRDTVAGEVKPFSVYADFVRDVIRTLQPFWDV